MNEFENDVSLMFARLPEPIQQKIIERVSGIVARCSINGAILDFEDLMVLTGRSRRFVTRLIRDKRFPKPMYLIDGNTKKGWQTQDVMRYLELRKRLW